MAAVLAAAGLLAACAERERPPPTVEPPPQGTPAPIPFPSDGRVIVDAREYPWSALGRLNTGGRGYCTGILISPSHVLASAPCLYNRIEGRWWHESEMHFVAGYQRDSWLADSPVRSYQRAPAFDPKAGASLGNVANNWALITLSKPIGRDTGWLAPRALDQDLRRRILLGEAQVVPAGYRRGRQHVILLNLGCGLAGAVVTASYIQPNCEVLPGDAGAPPLVFTGDALGPASEQMANTGPGSLGAALGRIGITPGQGRGPRPGAAAAALPLATIDYFLIHLGYLAPAAEGDFRAPDGAARSAAIRTFQSRNGLPADGRPSLSLLGYLIWAAQPPPVVG
ncbi:MAG: peptidoglycan-binding protein [Kiloniellales bacterium]|nr:peptidoglycan-binding protein [Kiloniellales bacterium]